MYKFLKKIVLRVLRTPPDPHAPQGNPNSLKVFRASKSYYRYRLYAWLAGQAVGFFTLCFVIICIWGAATALFQEFPDIQTIIMSTAAALTLLVLCLFVIAQLFSYTTLKLDYEMRWYMVTDSSLRIREGVAHVSEMTMTFANIQNISIEQGPIQRLFNISNLKVQTAGGGGVVANQQHAGVAMHIGWFRGVDNAQAIRDLMLERLRHYRDSGLGDTDDTPTASPTNHSALGSDPNTLQLLRTLNKEARLLRQAAERSN